MSSDRAIQPDYGMQFKTRPKLYEADWMMGCTALLESRSMDSVQKHYYLSHRSKRIW